MNTEKISKRIDINIDTDEIIILETWHEHCSVCFIAMKDLHPFFSNLEDKRHIYMYIGLESDSTEIINNKNLPYVNMELLIDKNQIHYNSLNRPGAPIFAILNKDKHVVKLINGYWSPYKNYYKLYFKYFI